METLNESLIQYLREQIGLEEHFCKVMQDQIKEIDVSIFPDAKDLLIKTIDVLEEHFTPLNEMLDRLENHVVQIKKLGVSSNGSGSVESASIAKKQARLSMMLRDDYSALNLITMSNTLLHTAALALQSNEVAELALKHLQNLAPLVIKIGELVPDVVARELRDKYIKVDINIAQEALKNTQKIWRNVT